MPWRRLAHWTDSGWSVEDGTYGLIAGLSSSDDRAQVTIDVDAGQVVRPGGIPEDRVEVGG